MALNIEQDEEQRAVWRQAFQLFDTDKKGYFTLEELSQITINMGMDATNSELRDMINDMDQNSDGKIDFDEFCTLMTRQSQKNPNATPRTQQKQAEQVEDEMWTAFNIFDKDGDGKITVQELRETLSMLGENLSTTEIQTMFDQIDTDNNQAIDFEEFKTMMMSGGM